MSAHPPADAAPAIPYKIAVLVYIWNSAGEMLLLHRKKPPNQHLYSPIGGKLEQSTGESPYACALREIEEEVGSALTLNDIRLIGIVSERAYAASLPAQENTAAPVPGSAPAHWLMFCFEVTGPLDFPARQIDEGRLEWHAPSSIPELPIPKTDREIIWPLVQKHSARSGDHAFFSVHIDCTHTDRFAVSHEQPRQ